MIQIFLLFLQLVFSQNSCQNPQQITPLITQPNAYTFQSISFVESQINCLNKKVNGTWIQINNQYDDYVSFKMTFSEEKETYWFVDCNITCENNTHYKYINLDKNESQLLFITFNTPYNTMSLEYIQNGNETAPIVIIPELPQTLETTLSQLNGNNKYQSSASFIAQRQWKYNISIVSNGEISTTIECQTLNIKQSFNTNAFEFESPQDNVEYKLTFESVEKQTISVGFEDVLYQPKSVEMVTVFPYIRYEIIPNTIMKTDTIYGFEYQINTEMDKEYIIDLCSSPNEYIMIKWIDTMFTPNELVCPHGRGLKYSIQTDSVQTFNFMIGYANEDKNDRGIIIKISQNDYTPKKDNTNIVLLTIIVLIIVLIILVVVILLIILIIKKKHLKNTQYETINSFSQTTKENDI